MNIDELFEKGVTPKEGEYAGQRFRVVSINKDGVSVREWDTNKFAADLKHGEYKVWERQKTLFDPHSGIEPTWGNLKKAAEAAGLDDATPIYVKGGFFGGIDVPWFRLCGVTDNMGRQVDKAMVIY